MSISETALKTAATIGQSLDRSMQLQRREQQRRENVAAQSAIDESEYGTIHPSLQKYVKKDLDNLLLARQSLIKNESGASARLSVARQRLNNEIAVMKARTKEYVDGLSAIRKGEVENTEEDLNDRFNTMIKELEQGTDFFESTLSDPSQSLLIPIAKPDFNAATINFPINMMGERIKNKIGTLEEGETVTREEVERDYESELKYLFKYPEYQEAVIANSFQNASEEEKEKGYVAYKQGLIATMPLEDKEKNLFNDAEEKYMKSLKEEVVNETYNFYSGRKKPKTRVDLPLISAFEAPEGVYEEGLYRPEGKGSPLTIPMDKFDVIIAPSENNRVVVTPEGEVKYYSKEVEAETSDIYSEMESGTGKSYAFAEVSEFPISEKLAGNIERAKAQARKNKKGDSTGETGGAMSGFNKETDKN